MREGRRNGEEDKSGVERSGVQLETVSQPASQPD
jgi:hypothetical protein